MRFYLLSLLVVLFMPRASALSDIAQYEHRSSVLLLHSRGIVAGYPDGTFRPHASINRAEFLKLVILAVYGDYVYTVSDRRCFTDFKGEEQWYWVHACAAKRAGIIQGHPDGTFRGEDTVNLAEALAMSLAAWNVPLRDAVDGEQWYQRYSDAAAEKGIFHRFPLTPSYLLTRGEMALLLTMMDEPIAFVGDGEQEDSTTVHVTFPETYPSVCGNGVVEHGEQCDDGNTVVGDGCSDLCIVVPEPIHHGVLRIEQLDVPLTNSASGNQDVRLFAFDAVAGRQDVYMTTLAMRSASGSLQNMENYRLIIDNDGDGVVESLYGKGVVQDERLRFDHLSVLVQDGFYKRMEIWADALHTVRPVRAGVQFDTSLPDFVEGVGKVDGDDVTGIRLNDADCLLESICWVSVYTRDPRNIEIGAQGNLFVTQSTPVSERQVLASQLSDPLLRLTFRADGEDIRVQTIAIEGVPESVASLSFYTDGALTPFATGRTTACATVISGQFCTDTDVVIPQDEERDILVHATFKPDTEGATSGETFTLRVSAVTTGAVAIEADGDASAKRLEQNDGDAVSEGEVFIGTTVPAANSAITGGTHHGVLAKIVDILIANPDADGSPIALGDTTFGRFRFEAAAHKNAHNGLNAVQIDTVVFTVTAINTELQSGSFTLFNPLQTSVVSSCTDTGTTGTITVTCDNLALSAVSTAIAEGESLDLALQGTVLQASVSPGTSILQATLQELGDPHRPGTVVWNDEETTFTWVDIDATQVRSTLYRLD